MRRKRDGLSHSLPLCFLLASVFMHSTSWRHGVTGYQWLVLFVAWLGWVFDSMDASIYSMVLQPALHELLHAQTGGAVSQEAIGWYGGIIFAIFLIGWALGGVMFGVLADRFGRTRTLIFTILIYAVFTGLAALSADWRHLAIYRFLTALGIGGEWAAGAALGDLSLLMKGETLPAATSWEGIPARSKVPRAE